MRPLIAIVEDDPDQCRNYADALELRGFSVATYRSRCEAIIGFKTEAPDLAIVDVVLGDEFNGGFELFREVADVFPNLPVIFLTSRTDEIDQVFGLRLGAWDYQTKPVSLTILVERVGALLKIIKARNDSSPNRSSETVRAGELTIDVDRVQIEWKHQSLQLTVTECALLAAIVRAKGGVIHYDDLAKITRQSVVTNNTINTHIRHIRAKFKLVDLSFDCIANVYGAGYRWSCT